MQLEFQHQVTRYARTLRGQSTLTASDFQLNVGGWFWEMLVDRASYHALQPAKTDTVTGLLRALRVLTRDTDWTQFANRSFGSFVVEDLAEMFHQCEELLLSAGITHFQTKRWASDIRQWCLDNLRKRGMPRIDRIRVLFRSRLRYPPSQARQLISDHADVSGDALPPVGAVSGEQVADIRKAMSKRLARDVEKLQAACDSELSDFDRLSAYVDEAIMLAREEHVALAEAASMRDYAAGARLRVLDPLDVERAYIALIARSHSQPYSPGLYRSFDGAAAISLGIGTKLKVRTAARLATTVLWSRFGSTHTLLACAFALQIKTGWNISSVFRVSNAEICWRKDGAEIQGFKSKTDDFTPPEHVEHGSLAARALVLLQRRVAKLKEVEWVGADESRLWLSPVAAQRGRASPVANWGAELKEFQEKHGLPRFSLDQVRNQVLAQSAMATGGIEVARRRAGHRSISTTGHYLDQALLHRLNSSINLEFQRRLERSIVLRLKRAEDVSDKEHAEDLLYPIGDGTSCIDPRLPPSSDYLRNGLCLGRHCHVGDGCPNRRVVIDGNRLEEIVRTAAFYERRWRHLLAQNEDAFHKLHLPALIFNVALLGILNRGPYRHLARSLEEKIQKELHE